MKTSAARTVVGTLFALALFVGLAAPGAAQENYNFRAGISFGLGGALNADPDPGLGNDLFQLAFHWRTQPKTMVGIRYGQFSFDNEIVGPYASPDLTYVTIAGEYVFRETYYTSGVFLGLGLYDLEAANAQDEAIGLALGLSGDFPITPRFSVVVEAAGHFVDLPEVTYFASLQAGVAFNF